MIEPGARLAWRELDAKLRPFVARRVRSEVDVDDIVQEVFLRMQRGLAELRDEERFGPWVYRVARSAIVDHHRRTSRDALPSSSLEVWGDSLPEDSTPPTDDERAIERELATYVAPFVAMLPSPYREALTLVELEGLSQKRGAEMLGISVSGMKSRVQRGRAKLREALEECCAIALDARGRVLSCEVRPDGCAPDGCCAKSSANLRNTSTPPCVLEPESPTAVSEVRAR